jgi:hypothetical protein
MWTSWALADLGAGELTGSANLAEPTPAASMVKAWLAADYLTRFGMHPALESIVADSANEPAWELFAELGRERSIERMIEVCGLTDSAPGADLSLTLMSARDTVRLGRAIANGTAAGSWTSWLLSAMKSVRGTGDFGIRHAFSPAHRGEISVKNGWEKRNEISEWNVNCLAIGDSWTMAVLTRYPAELPLSHGAAIGERLAAALLSVR